MRNLQLVTTPNIPTIPKGKYSSLKLRALADNGRRVRLLLQRIDYFDVLLLWPTPDGIKTLGYEVLVPRQDFLPVVPVLGHPTLKLPYKKYKTYLPVENSRMKQVVADQSQVTGESGKLLRKVSFTGDCVCVISAAVKKIQQTSSLVMMLFMVPIAIIWSSRLDLSGFSRCNFEKD